MNGLMIDFETADRITLLTLKEQLAYLMREQAYFETPVHERDGRLYVHPEDYALNRDKHIPALKHLINYFGGTSDPS